MLAERTGVAAPRRRDRPGLGLGAGHRRAGRRPTADLPVTDLPGFLPPAVEGHAGRIRSLEVGGKRVLAFLGRTHLYEGRGVEPVVHGVRVAAAAGCRVVVLTNACGGLRPGLAVGDPVLISDHLNLTWRTPLVGPRFVDLTDVYSAPAARARARDRARHRRGRLRDVPRARSTRRRPRCGWPACSAPTSSACRPCSRPIAAHAEGCEVLGISLVTNLAAGLGDPLDHEEVLAVGRASATRMGTLLAQVIPRL